MKTSSLSRVLIAAIAFALPSLPAAASVPPPAPAPSATFNVGSLRVQQYGDGQRALIFIPGLACGPWEWSGQIAHFASRYTIYAVTLPGFDGQPPISGPLFATATADFWKLLDEKHITKPVVIGHSLGGTMGFMLATQHPGRLGGVISLDGLPIYPGSAFLTPKKVKAMATATALRLASLTPAQFAAEEKTQILPYLITAQSDVNAIAPLVAKSDPAASGKWLEEDMLLDLRPELPKANVPILLIAPYDASVDARFGASTIGAKQAFYAGLVKGAPNLRIVMIDHSRHFAMYDQPQAVSAAIAGFLAQAL